MKITGSIPRTRRLASYRGRVMIDTVRGVLRVRKWPKKRGTPRSALQRWWNDWFRQANLLAKYADGMTQARAIAITKGSGLYPRDVMLKAMRGRLYIFADQDGMKWYPMAAIQDISDSLDVLAQTIGSVLVRATDRWRAPDPGSVGDVLTYNGTTAPPNWQTLTPGAGVVQQNLAGTPVVPDDTAAAYEFDVTGYASLELSLDGIGFAANDAPWLRYSIDNGATYKSGASDYRRMHVSSIAMGSDDQAQIYLSTGEASSGHHAMLYLSSLRAGRATAIGGKSHNAATAKLAAGFANFDGPVTNIKILSKNGNNFDAGTIRLTGLVAA